MRNLFPFKKESELNRKAFVDDMSECLYLSLFCPAFLIPNLLPPKIHSSLIHGALPHMYY